MTHGEGGLFGEGAHRFDEIDTTVSHDLRRELTIGADDPLSARYASLREYELGREGWRIRIETQTSMQATATDFVLQASVRAYENGALAGAREMATRRSRAIFCRGRRLWRAQIGPLGQPSGSGSKSAYAGRMDKSRLRRSVARRKVAPCRMIRFFSLTS